MAEFNAHQANRSRLARLGEQAFDYLGFSVNMSARGRTVGLERLR